MLTKYAPLCAWLVVAWLIALAPRAATARDLMLHPTRVVFEKNQRASQVELINNGSATVTYRISLVNRRMNEFGQFSDANPPLPGEQFADEMVRFSPRQIVLAPGATQTVRIMVRKPAVLAEGEYRSHLMFTQVADDAATSGAAGEPEGLSINLTPLIGASIPIIVRHGQTAATAKLGNLRIEPSEASEARVLALDIHRDGNRSLYGDMLVTFAQPRNAEQPGSAEQAIAARINGMAVYSPNDVRRVRIALPSSATVPGTTLRIVFQQRPEDGGKPLAEAGLVVP